MKPLQFIKLVLLTLLLFVSNNNSFANPIVITEAGTLYSYIDATDKNSITDLTVTGYLNGDDILFLREMAGSDKNGGSTAGNLRTLDISGASIVAGGGLYFENPEVGEFGTEDNVLGVAMFAMCDKLTSITLPATLSSANILAFAFCENLEAINVPASNTSLKSVDGVLFDYDMENLYSYPQKRSNTSYTVPVSVKSIRSYAFQGSKYLKSVVLPEGLETLEQGVFYYSEQLESINIPESITEIPDFFLGNCSKLSSITLPTGLTAIGSHAFASCVKLQIVTLPTTLKTIGSIAFADCIELRSLTLSPGLTTIEDGCFKNSGLESIAIPSTVTTIEDWAFWNCRQLVELKMYHNSDHIMPFNNNWMNIDYNIVLYVPEGSFYAYSNSDGWNDFSQIIEFEVEEEEEEPPYVEPMFIEIDVALAGTLYSYIDATDKNSITDLTVTGYLNGDDILFLREMAGSDINGGSTAGNLRTLDLSGASIVAGGGIYFENPEIGEFETEDNVLGVAMFAMCDKLTFITLPATLSSANILAFAFCENLEAINVPASNTSLKSVDGVLFDYGMENLYSYPQKRSNTSYTVPVTVKSIRFYAFQGSKYLKSVVLPEGLETLEDGVFYYSAQLESINIPESITEIPEFFLSNCSKLLSITLPTV
ncbi:MAG TPA: leucine-rich repeat domain-containing protein [Bacteroidaceae bacterium]|nr:leucine-rich repeat domain-containing protein [Bacteroidaceae bacterium]